MPRSSQDALTLQVRARSGPSFLTVIFSVIFSRCVCVVRIAHLCHNLHVRLKDAEVPRGAPREIAAVRGARTANRGLSAWGRISWQSQYFAIHPGAIRREAGRKTPDCTSDSNAVAKSPSFFDQGKSLSGEDRFWGPRQSRRNLVLISRSTPNLPKSRTHISKDLMFVGTVSSWRVSQATNPPRHEAESNNGALARGRLGTCSVGLAGTGRSAAQHRRAAAAAELARAHRP